MDILIHNHLFESDVGMALLSELTTPYRARMVAPSTIVQAQEAVVVVSFEGWPSHITYPEHLMPYSIFVSNKPQNESAIHYLEKDCGDFLMGPPTVGFLAAKTRSLCRRLESEFVSGRVSVIENQCPKKLTEKERKLLSHLVRSGLNGADRESLLHAAWRPGDINQKTLDTHLFNLRQKLVGANLRVDFSGGRWRLSHMQSQRGGEI